MLLLKGYKPGWQTLKSIRRFLININHLKQHNGLPGVVKYLKGCSVLLQQMIAGYKIPDSSPLGLRIKRTRSGFPVIIPRNDRISIISGGTAVMRLYLTLFSIFRNIEYSAKVSFKTITAPYTGTSNLEFFTTDEITSFLKNFIKFSELDKISPFSIRSASPTTVGPDHSTSYQSLLRALLVMMKPEFSHISRAIRFFISFTNSQVTFNIFETTWNYVLRYIYLVPAKFVNFEPGIIDIRKGFIVPSSILGSLEIKPEPAGKMRVFAMVDGWTQWVLHPLHSLIFKNLKNHPNIDGTFDQLGPLKRVPWESKDLYVASLDLSAATDRLPIWIQISLLNNLFGSNFGFYWALLFDRPFFTHHLSNRYPEVLKGPESIKYAVGQPMGALSSWPMLALTHHFIVQVAAVRAGLISKNQLFTEYVVLGDDVIIWNKAVSVSYRSIMKSLGVELNLSKSILSCGLGCEFAKRTFFKGIDVSPFPLKEAQAAHVGISPALELARKYNISLDVLLRYLGYGWRTNINSLSKKVFILKMMASLKFTNVTEFFKCFTSDSFLHYYSKSDKVHIFHDKIIDFLKKDLIRLANKSTSDLHILESFLTEVRFTSGTSMPNDNVRAIALPSYSVGQALAWAAYIMLLIIEPSVISAIGRLRKLRSESNALLLIVTMLQSNFAYFGAHRADNNLASYLPMMELYYSAIQRWMDLSESISGIIIKDIIHPKRSVPLTRSERLNILAKGLETRSRLNGIMQLIRAFLVSVPQFKSSLPPRWNGMFREEIQILPPKNPWHSKWKNHFWTPSDYKKDVSVKYSDEYLNWKPDYSQRGSAWKKHFRKFPDEQE
jgi:hypothetical protein